FSRPCWASRRSTREISVWRVSACHWSARSSCSRSSIFFAVVERAERSTVESREQLGLELASSRATHRYPCAAREHDDQSALVSDLTNVIEIDDSGAMNAQERTRVEAFVERCQRGAQHVPTACGVHHHVIVLGLDPDDLGNVENDGSTAVS